MNTARKRRIIFCSFLLFTLLIRLIKINNLPAALFGDVIQHLIKARDLDFSWFGGDGPLFTVITAVTTRILGFNFLTLKLTTIFISLLGIIFTYLYTKKLTNKISVAYFASIFMALSFWNISLSHQGKPYILVPFFAVLVSYFLLLKKYFWAGIILGISTYSQASAWGLLPLALIAPQSLVGTLIAGSLFFKNIFFSPFSLIEKQSYLGQKINISELNLPNILNSISIVFSNLFKQIRAFFTNGDSCFRSNIPLQAHLDIVTATFFAIGIIFIVFYTISYIKKYRFKQFFKTYFNSIFITFISPFFLIQLPAAFDINNPLSVPNHGRTLGVTPYVFIIAAYGLYRTSQLIKKTSLLPVLVFTFVAAINLYNFWFIYPKTLPNNNVPFAEVIAHKASLINPQIPVFVYGTGWGDYGQPESNSFMFLPNNGFLLHPFIDDLSLCNSLNPKFHKAVVFTSPYNLEFIKDLTNSGCNYWQVSSKALIEESGQQVALEFVLTNSLN